MVMTDVTRSILKNLNILHSKNMVQFNQTQFLNSWEVFITDLRNDTYIKKTAGICFENVIFGHV